MTNKTSKTSGVFPSLPAILVEEGVRAALREDLGRAGDLTTDATIGAPVGASVGKTVGFNDGSDVGMGVGSLIM